MAEKTGFVLLRHPSSGGISVNRGLVKVASLRVSGVIVNEYEPSGKKLLTCLSSHSEAASASVKVTALRTDSSGEAVES